MFRYFIAHGTETRRHGPDLAPTFVSSSLALASALCQGVSSGA